MANITLRNIPDSVFDKLKFLSEVDRRSLNNEMLVALERGVRELEKEAPLLQRGLSVEAQTALWSDLAGKWRDSKPKTKTIREIYSTRSLGRDVAL